MIKWEDLNVYQKTAFWLFIGIVGWFSPEIALLFQFGGIEVVFAFLAVYTIPIIRQVCTVFDKAKYKTKQVIAIQMPHLTLHENLLRWLLRLQKKQR